MHAVLVRVHRATRPTRIPVATTTVQRTHTHTLSNRNMNSYTGTSPYIVMDPFCLRQFTEAGQPYLPCTPDAITAHVNAHYEALIAARAVTDADAVLAPGYAPFCTHLFLPNPNLNVAAAYVPITPDNKHLLVSSYAARTEKELPVLVRSFPKGSVSPPTATWLDIILYSREQIAKENAAMATTKQPTPASSTATTAAASSLPSLSPHFSSGSNDSRWKWGIVSIKPQLVDHETPMQPITMMRNALGVQEGGSGIPLDREQYVASVRFWEANATTA